MPRTIQEAREEQEWDGSPDWEGEGGLDCGEWRECEDGEWPCSECGEIRAPEETQFREEIVDEPICEKCAKRYEPALYAAWIAEIEADEVTA